MVFADMCFVIAVSSETTQKRRTKLSSELLTRTLSIITSMDSLFVCRGYDLKRGVCDCLCVFIYSNASILMFPYCF